jgi:DNA-binding SARP family transcriptional activator
MVADNCPSFQLLGRFEVRGISGPIPYSAWRTRKALMLTKFLVAYRGSTFSYSQLIELIYADTPPEKALKALYNRMSEVRTALRSGGPELGCVVRQGGTYSFPVVPECTVDLETFRSTLAAANELREAEHLTRSVEKYCSAISLYRGAFLEEDLYEEWTQNLRVVYSEDYLTALSNLAKCYAALGQYEKACLTCERVLNSHPHREAVIRQLMGLYAVIGESSKAISVYNKGTRALAENLEVQPAAETTQLYKEIVSGRGSKEKRHLDRKRIAVLPFSNVGGNNENDFFVDGLTEEMMHTLSNVRDLHVVAHASIWRFRKKRGGYTGIGRELGVGSILTGSVRILGDNARITATLINTENDEQVWSESFDRSLVNVLTTQRKIAERVADALEIRLGVEAHKRLRSLGTQHWEAYRAHLSGRYHWNRRTPADTRRAIQYFKDAIAADPKYVAARQGLADAWAILGDLSRSSKETTVYAEKAESEARHVLSLDPQRAEPHATLGFIQMFNKRDPIAAERWLRSAIRIDSGYSAAYHWLGMLLIGLGRFDDGVEALQKSLELDPLSPVINRTLGQALYNARRYEEAIQQLSRTEELDGKFLGIHFTLGLIYLEQRRYEDAIRCFEQETTLNGHVILTENTFADIARSRAGDRSRLLSSLADLRIWTETEPSSVRYLWAAFAFLEAGDETFAFSLFERAIEADTSWLIMCIHSPLFDCVNSRPWYVSLLRRAGLASES